MNYVSELLEDYPPTMSAQLLAFLLTAGSGRPDEEYRAEPTPAKLRATAVSEALAALSAAPLAHDCPAC